MSSDWLLFSAMTVSILALLAHTFFVMHHGARSHPALIAHAFAAASFFAVGLLAFGRGDKWWGSATIFLGCLGAATFTHLLRQRP